MPMRPGRPGRLGRPRREVVLGGEQLTELLGLGVQQTDDALTLHRSSRPMQMITLSMDRHERRTVLTGGQSDQ